MNGEGLLGVFASALLLVNVGCSSSTPVEAQGEARAAVDAVAPGNAAADDGATAGNAAADDGATAGNAASDDGAAAGDDPQPAPNNLNGNCWARCCNGTVQRPEGTLDTDACITKGNAVCSDNHGTERIRLDGRLIASLDCE